MAALVLFFSLVFAGPVLAQPNTLPANDYQRLDHALDSLRARYRVPGLAAVVAKGGDVTFARGYGWADVERRVPVTASTPFRIASLTKPLSAALLLRLAGQGRLELDRPFARYVPRYGRLCQRYTSAEVQSKHPALRTLTEDWRCRAEQDSLTVRHYLTHTAQGEPGASYRYNGFLYGQLYRVAEEAGGRSFAALLRDSLFAPAGMRRTLPSQADSSRQGVLSALARPYHVGSGGQRVRSDYPALDVNAGAGVISTALDLARFDAALNSGEVLSEETRAAMFSPARSLRTGERLPYGLGWFIQEHEGRRLVWHYGWQPEAYSGLWLRVPGRKLTLILLANSEALSAPFDLGEGDVTRSPFAQVFLDALASTKQEAQQR